MKFIPQFPVQQLSGHDGQPNGLVAMRSNGIDIFRRYVVPMNPQTSEQDLVRSAFTISAQAFKLLTDNQRATWTTWAQADPVNVLGRSITLQDIASYQRSNFWSRLKLSSNLTTAPTAAPGYSVSSVSGVVFDTPTSTLTISIVHNSTSTANYWAVKQTAAAATAQRNARPSDYRLVKGASSASIVATAATSPSDLLFTDPTFSYEIYDIADIEIIPISADFAIGTSFHWRGTVQVS